MLGRTLSHYEILEKLGEGGMGIVWKARDTRLNRLVAIKVLPADKVANADRKRRFIQEAQAASALNHPNIIVIHDIASEDGIDFIVMEYVAGVTLDRRIPRHGMRLGELLDIAIQIADALVKAHGAGIIHRDLKPGNIMINEDGRVKLLDFGLAKLTEVGAGLGEDDATRTVKAATEDGAIVGTIAYMSPEQAEAKLVDARSDIFSFGSVLYEMATGTRAFRGDSKLSTLSAILRENPKPPSELVQGTPRDLEKIITRCLKKDPARRFQAMPDLKVALTELKEESESGTLEPAAKPMRRKRSLRLLLAGAAGAVLIAAAAGWMYLRSPSKPLPPARVIPLTAYAGSEEHPTFSPDGTQVAFSWNGEKRDNYDIYVELVDGGAPLRLTTNPATDTFPAWSPDGRWIAFIRDGAVYLISPLGGVERKVVEARVRSVAWTPDSQSLVVSGQPKENEPPAIYQVSSGTSEMRRLSTPNSSIWGDIDAAVSPDGQRVAFVRYDNQHDLYVSPLTGGDIRRLTNDRSLIGGLVWVDDREIVFSSARTGGRALWRVAADGRSQPQPVLGTEGEAFYPAFAARSAKSPSRLAYQRATSDYNIWGMQVALGDDGTARTVTPAAPVIASTRLDTSPKFSPDGKKIVFASNRSGYTELWVAAADGSNQVQLTSLANGQAGSPRWSPDGQRIVFDSVASGNNDIWMINGEGGAPRRVTTEPSNDGRPSWSQDGRWIYFRSDRSGTQQIWKIPATEPYKPAVQVTRNGGFDAIESVDGKRLYFSKRGKGLWSLPPDGGEEELVLDVVPRGYWAVAEKGIYFVDLAKSHNPIEFFSFAKSKMTRAGAIDKPLNMNVAGFTVTRDGRWIAWSQMDREESDLMLLENFR